MFLYSLFSNFEMPALLVVLLAYIIALMIALSIHEFAHAFVANREGDLTAKAYGRLSLNPFAHIDPIGLIFLLLVGFGWAKPVPINPLHMKNGKKSVVKVSIAGVIANLILSIIFSFFYALTLALDESVTFYLFLQQFCGYTMTINFVFFVFNLLPIYPLDGFNLIASLSKQDNAFLNFMYKYGFWILLLLYITRIFDYILVFLQMAILNPLFNLWLMILF